MIAFSDSGLAHLAIGASRIPRSRRKRWLTDLARHIELGEPLKPRCRSAMRTRAYRRRIADGTVRLEIVADLPMTSMLKIDKRALADLAAQPA